MANDEMSGMGPREARRPASGWERRRERISLEIERAALQLFAQTSPEDVTVDGIAAAAGISRRTFFRYFATRDEILAALPKRSLARITDLIRSRPASESIFEAFTEAERTSADPAERDIVLLWGIVVHRFPDTAARAMAESAVGMPEAFQRVIAEREGWAADDPTAGIIGAALAGVVGYTYGQWVRSGGATDLAEELGHATEILGQTCASSMGTATHRDGPGRSIHRLRDKSPRRPAQR